MTPVFIHLLHYLPTLAIWTIVLVMNLLVFLILPLLVRSALKINLNVEVVKGADEAFKTLVGLTIALIAFALVQVEGLHRNVGDLVSREGAILLTFDRTLSDVSGPATLELKKPFRAYVSSVIDSEWPTMANGERSGDTTAKLAALSPGLRQVEAETRRSTGSINNGTLEELSGQLIQIKDVREARLSASDMSLSSYFWWGILLAMFALAILGWFQSPPEKAFPYLGGIVIGLSALLAVLIVSAGIFEGESRVSPDAIEKTSKLISPQSLVTQGASPVRTTP